MATFQQKLKDKEAAYASVYRIDELNDANDRSTLDIMLKTEVMIDDLQEELQKLITEDAVKNAGDIKKLADLLRDATGTITTLQKTLAIDRKTRKTEETGSVVDYIRSLKRMAGEFMEQRLTKVYCPNCKVMVGRFMAVHEHTGFNIQFQCSQCGKAIRARRNERDVLFDVKDADWRRGERAEIIQPNKKRRRELSADLTDDQLRELDNDDAIVIGTPEMYKDEIEIPEDTNAGNEQDLPG